MGKYQLKLSVRKLAAIRISKHLWTLAEIKKSLKLLVSEDETSLTSDSMELQDLYNRNKQIFLKITNKVDELILPEPARNELILAVGSMGIKMFNWLEEIKRQRHDTLNLSLYTDHICWTHYGCIDKSETIRSLYISNNLPHNYETWIKLSNNCLEDCIEVFCSKSPEYNSYFQEMAWLRYGELHYEQTLSFYWDSKIKNNFGKLISHLESFPNHIKIYDDQHSIEENMFRISVVTCNYSAIKYFWKFLDENQRLRTISKLSERPIHYDPIMEKCKYVLFEEGESHTELLTFLLHKLYIYKIDDLLTMMLGSGVVLRKFLTWPWQDIFMGILEESWKYHKSIDYNLIITEILYSLHMQYETVGTDFTYRKIFYEIWERNPENLKQSIDYLTILNELWEMKDIGLSKYIINNRDLKEKRDDFLDYIAKRFNDALTPDFNSDFLDNFIEHVLVSDEERTLFRLKVENMSEYDIAIHFADSVE